MIIDSHCHLYSEKLEEIREEILNNLDNNLICICSADCIETSIKCIKLSNRNKNVYATVGFHPHEAEGFTESSLLELEELVKQNNKVVAIGEIGLDYYYDFSPREIQKEVLEKQIVLADKLNLPCVFHVREATEDFLNIIKNLAKKYKIRGVVHSFSGSIETAKILLNFGFYLGINGIITFKNANKMLDVVKFLPLDKILIETDAPYLTPVPFRGQANRPEYVRYVAEKIAELKEISVEDVINITTQNAKELFNI